MIQSSAFRLILDGPRSASLNMAIDEMLVQAQSAPNSVPCLRFYEWDTRSVTIGYFQDARRIASRLKYKPVVRRLTGGGLVLHDGDLTFSLTLTNPNAFFPVDVKGSYLKVNEALRAGLKEIYPELDYFPCKDAPSGRGSDERVCFETPSCYDLLLKGKKVVGASQRRLDGAILHQSTLFLKENKIKLAEAIVRGFKKVWSVDFIEKALTREELELSGKIEIERYASAEWAVR